MPGHDRITTILFGERARIDLRGVQTATEIQVLPPGSTSPLPWDFPDAKLSPDEFLDGALADELYGLLEAGGPYISARGSPQAVAYLHSAQGKLAWSVLLLNAGETLKRFGALAWVNVSMNVNHSFLAEAYAAKRKLRRKRATRSLTSSDLESCQKVAYVNYAAVRLKSWLAEAEATALRWRPQDVQYELPFHSWAPQVPPPNRRSQGPASPDPVWLLTG